MKTLFSILLFFITIHSDARYLTDNEIWIKYLSYINNTTVNRDGSFTETITYSYIILDERARSEGSIKNIHYSPNSEKIILDDLYVINNGKKIYVQKSNIIEKDTDVNSYGFDSIKVIQIMFPDVGKNSVVHTKYTKIKKIPYVNNHFSVLIDHPMYAYYENYEYNISSLLPLNFQIIGPREVYNVNNLQKNDQYIINIKLKDKSPSLSDSRYKVLNIIDRDSVLVSTNINYNFLNDLASTYDKLINENIPDPIMNILNDFKEKEIKPADLHDIALKLNHNIRYFGDWRPINGGIIPRSFKTIAETMTADCKEYSIILAALYRKLGLISFPAIIQRSEVANDFQKYPYMHLFNHAITYVRFPNSNQEYYLDATNSKTLKSGIFKDISDRDTVILDPKAVVIKHTPVIGFQDNIVYEGWTYQHIANDLFQVSVQGKYYGSAAEEVTSLYNEGDRISIESRIKNGLFSTAKNIFEFNVEPIIFNKDELKDSEINVHSKVEFDHALTNYGNAFKFRSGNILFLEINPGDKDFGNTLGTPMKHIFKTIIKNTNVGKLKQNCNIDSKWHKFSRKVYQSGKDLINEETVINKVKYIPLTELRSDDYKELIKKTRACFKTIHLII